MTEPFERETEKDGSLALSVVVPILNEEENLELLCPRLTKVMDSLQESYEILFVDDGSSDDLHTVLRRLAS